MSWQFRGVRDPAMWEELLRSELEPRLQRSMEEAVRDGWLQLEAVYGYWPALADGNTVVVYDPGDIDAELGRFTFPRQSEQNRLCLADYIRPAEDAADGERDVIALQVVTTGPGASELSNRLQVDGAYDDMLRIHGFATQMAEATAEYVHHRIRRELRLGEDQGRRYSWGYPSCPDLEDHEILMRIVPACRDRRDAHRGVSVRAGAVDWRDRHAPSGGAVLRRLRRGAGRGGRARGAGAGVVCARGLERSDPGPVTRISYLWIPATASCSRASTCRWLRSSNR